MTYENLVQQYYVGFYGRPADKEGLDYWTAKVDEANGDFTEIQDAFANSAEYENFVLTDADGEQRSYEELVNFIYNNLFGRDAEEEGLNYYVEGLEDGTFTLVSIVQNIIDGAEAGSTDKAVFQNRLQVAQSFTDGVYDNFKSYQAEDILDARGVLYLVDESGNSLSNALGAANSWISQQEFRPIDPPTADTTFTLERIDPTVHSETDTKLMWGAGDQMVSACAMLSYLEDLVGNDLFDWSIVGQDGHGVLGPDDASIFLEQFENKNISITTDENEEYEDGELVSYTLSITETDTGEVTTHQFTASYQYMNFVQRLLWGDEETGEGGLLFDSDGNIRIWEWSNENQEITYYANILTPESSFGVFESGYTTDADDLIVAGRPELLHGAYIDGGGGFNTLEVDMKGPFAQPLQLLNIQKVSIQNLPNIYDDFWGDRFGDGSGSYERVDQNLPDGQLPDDYDGNYEGGYGQQTEHFPYPFPNYEVGTENSVLDLSRAVHLKQLVITEGTDVDTHDQWSPGSLTVFGIRNGVTSHLDGGFTQNVYLHYGESVGNGVNLKLSNLNMEDAMLWIAQNSDTLNIESTGGGNWLEDAYLGGRLSNMNITGDAHLYIEGDLEESFHADNRVTVDASQNTGGVNLTLSDNNVLVTFLGTNAGDIFNAEDNKEVRIYGGAGENIFTTDGSEKVFIASGSSNDQISSENSDSVTIEVDGGDNIINTDGSEEVSIATGDGDDVISSVRGETVTVASSGGDNEIVVSAEEINITTGDGNDTIIVSGMGDSMGDSGWPTALLNIDTGAGDNTVVLGRDVPFGYHCTLEMGVTALEGSSITGENITLYVENPSDLRAAQLSGIESVVFNHDVSDFDGDNQNLDPVLTLTDSQFKALVDDGVDFSVEGSIFNTYAQLKIIVTGEGADTYTFDGQDYKDVDLSDMGVDILPRNIDLQLEVRDGVQLTMTAKQLHTLVAPEGVTKEENSSNYDLPSGRVVITDAGNLFDPFNTNDQVRSVIAGNTYYGGSLSLDFLVDGGDPTDMSDWFNVGVARGPSGYNRPQDTVTYDFFRWNTDEDGTEVGPFSTVSNVLQFVGEQGFTFTPVEGGLDQYGRPIEGATAISVGITSGSAGDFWVDFSSLGGEAVNLTLANFEFAQGVYGNGSETMDARVNVELGGNVGSAAGGLVSAGVLTYVVTDMNEDNRQFWTSNVTKDLETLGLQGNYGYEITFGNVARGVEFLLEVDYDKFDGYAVGKLTGVFARAGADAVVNIENISGDLPAGEVLKVEGIELVNAATVTVNVNGGDAVIESLTSADLESLYVSSANDVEIAGDLPLTVTTIDAGDVEGTFTAMIDGVQASGSVDADYAFTFIGAQGGSTLTLEDLADAGEHVIDGGAAGVDLIIQDEVDLSEASLTGVNSITLNNDDNSPADNAVLTLSMAQVADIGAENISHANAPQVDANLNLVGLDGEEFALANFGDGIVVGSVSLIDDPVVTLHENTDLTGIDSLTVPEGTTLNLTAAQYQQLGSSSVKIDGEGTVNITDLTQADVEDGLDLSLLGSDVIVGTVTMAEDIELAAGDDLGDFEVVIGDDMTLTLADISQADGLVIGGGTNTTLKFTDTSAGMFESIDASGFNVDTLMILNVLVANRNVDLMFQGLPEGVTKVIYNDLGWVEGLTQYVVIEEGTTVPGFLVFNRPEAETEIRHFDLTLEGGTEIEGNLRLSQSGEEAGLLQVDLQSVTIHSNGDAENLITGETANIIRGDITSQGTGSQGSYTSEPNDLLNVTINADQDFILQGKVVFESVVASEFDDGITANDDYNATATLNVDGPADVTIADLDTSDDEVVALVINHTGDGALTVGLSSLTSIDNDDEITFNGSATGMDTIVISGEVDLSDDTLVNVDAIVIDETGAFGGAGANDPVLTLSQEQLDDIGAGNITVDEEGGQTSTLNIVELGSDPFDATALDEDIDIINIFTAEGNITLDPTTNLTGVDMITVPEGSTLNLTAEQYQQLDGNGTIVGIDDDGNPTTDITINITDLTQADVDLGFDLSGVAADNLSVTLAEDVYLAATDDLNNAEVNVGDNLTLGLAIWTQADGLVVNGGTDSTVIFQFDSVPTVFTQIDASGYDITTLKALATFVGGNNAEYTIDDLPSSVILRLYQDPEELGFLNPTHRTVFIEEGVFVPDNFAADSLIFNDWDPEDEVLTLSITMDGDVEVNGDISLPTRTDKDGSLVQRYFQTLTLTSQGDDANVINGGINTQPSLGGANTSDNNLMDIVINAYQDLNILDAIVFNHEAGTDTVADLLITGDANVSIKALDTTDATITGLTINNAGTGTLTVTGGSDALELNNTEMLVFEGTGDIVLDTDNGADNNGIEGDSLESINAAGLSGNLTLGVIEAVDSENFTFTSGTGTTTLTLNEDSVLQNLELNAAAGDSGWTFDMNSAGVGSELRIQNVDWTQGSLNIDLGLNTTLYIGADTDWTNLDLTLEQTLPIQLVGGSTLTLTAEQADGLMIEGNGTVNITELENGEVYDFSQIAGNVAGTITLAEDDVTVHEDTDLGEFSITLEGLDAGPEDLSGQTIRFSTVEQAERDVIVTGETGAENSTNVVWLFDDVLTDPVDTSGYFQIGGSNPYQVGRLWFNDDLVINNGGDIEQLFNTLPNTILRLEFADLTELDILLSSGGFDRVFEAVAFSDVASTGLTFSDIELQAHVRSLELRLGGEVDLGDIEIGNMLATGVNPATISFNTLTISSYRALHQNHFLAPEGYVNDNDGIDEPGEHVQPGNVNYVGDINMTGDNVGLTLLDIVLNTGSVSTVGGGFVGSQGAELDIQTITFSANEAGATAEIDANGENDITIKSLDTSDPDITALVVDTIGHTGVYLVTGGSPAAAVGDTEALTINPGDAGEVYFGHSLVDGDYELNEYAGVAGDELSMLDVTGNGYVNLGVIAQIDGTDDDTTEDGIPDRDAFTLNGNGNTYAILGQALVNGVPTAPLLEDGSTWAFNDVNLTITGDVVFQPGASLVFGDTVLYIDGNVDLSEVNVDWTAEGNSVFVPEGSVLTLSVAQVLALADANDPDDGINPPNGMDIVGSGTVKIVGDGTVDDDTDFDLAIALGEFIKTVNVDVSEITIDTDVDTGGGFSLYLTGAVDDEDNDVGQSIVGSANNDLLVTNNEGDNTFAVGGGNDVYYGIGGGNNTFLVEQGIDVIFDLEADDPADSEEDWFKQDVLQVDAGATAYGIILDEFFATEGTVNNGTTVLIGLPTMTQTVIDVSMAEGSEGFTLIGSATPVNLDDYLDVDPDFFDTVLALVQALEEGIGGIGGSRLIGSSNNDIINGGNDEFIAARDILTGNGGDDTFVFNTTISDPALLESELVETAVDIERLEVTAATDAGNVTSDALVVSYRLNATNTAVNVDITSVDVEDAEALASAIAARMNLINGITAVTIEGTTPGVNDVVELTGDNGNAIELLGVGPLPTLSIEDIDLTETADSDDDDVLQESLLTFEFDNGQTEATIGETYNLTINLRNGQEIVIDQYVADGTEDEEALRDAILASLNAELTVLEDPLTATAVGTGDPGDPYGIRLEGVTDEGGFDITTFSASGAFSGSGASQILVGDDSDLASADIITDFNQDGNDVISLGLAAGAGGVSGNFDFDAVQYSTYSDAFDAANAALGSNVIYFFTSIEAEVGASYIETGVLEEGDTVGLLFFDANNNGDADGVIALIGVDDTMFQANDIVA